MVYLESGNKQTAMDLICLRVAHYLLQKAGCFHLAVYPETWGQCPAEVGTATYCLGRQGEAGSLTAIHLFVLEIRSPCKLVIRLLTSLTHLYTAILPSEKGTPAQWGLNLKWFNYARNTNLKPQLNYVFLDNYCFPSPGWKIHNFQRIQRAFNYCRESGE